VSLTLQLAGRTDIIPQPAGWLAGRPLHCLLPPRLVNTASTPPSLLLLLLLSEGFHFVSAANSKNRGREGVG